MSLSKYTIINDLKDQNLNFKFATIKHTHTHKAKLTIFFSRHEQKVCQVSRRNKLSSMFEEIY